LNLSFVLSHSPEWSTLCSGNDAVIAHNANTPAPRFTTSAGDHFTAGVCFGLLAGVDADVLPIYGNCTTSYFVRSGVSPTADDIRAFLRNYATYLETKTPDIIE
jgi:sugar/nucleoside kinase (ribokinase family)